MGAYLLERLRTLQDKYPFIGDVRGRGLLAGIEFVTNKKTKDPFPKELNVGSKATSVARGHGLLIYPRRSIMGLSGDHVSLAPPLIIDEAGIDEIMTLLDKTLADVSAWLQKHHEKNVA